MKCSVRSAEYDRTRDIVLSISGHANLLEEEPVTACSPAAILM